MALLDRPQTNLAQASKFRPSQRLRRLRATPALRAMVRETELNARDFIYPLFVRHGSGRTEIRSMPGIFQLSVAEAVREVELAASLGIPAVILFGIPAQKDPIGREDFSHDGIVQRAIRAIKREIPEMVVITDVCLCEYTDHGHCGILNSRSPKSPDFGIAMSHPTSGPTGTAVPMDGVRTPALAGSAREDAGLLHPHLPEGYVLNDETLEILGQVALSHADAGADIVAPSDMIDGMVAAIRDSLDSHGFEHLPILSYSVKYASALYGPFREAAKGAPKFGDRKSHQMDPANVREAVREAATDIEEGADLLMVKPALPYLDVIHRVRQSFPELPLVAYNVSGEYAMIKAAAANGWLDERAVTLETLTAIKRAGADLIITYHAKQAARWLME